MPIFITHVCDRMLRNGGAEIFLRSLATHLDPNVIQIRQSICTSNRIDSDFADSFSFPVIQGGVSELNRAIDMDDIILCWGHVQLDTLKIQPRVCIFNACAEVRYQLNRCRRTVTFVISCSTLIRRSVAFGFPAKIILPGIEPGRLSKTISREVMRESLGIRTDEFVVGMVARLEAQKRQRWLMEAVRNLSNTKAVFVGEGPEEGVLRFTAPENCLFTGHREDIGNYYQCFDAFCLLSASEGCSAALFEAMFSELPVIVTPVGSVPDLIQNNISGLVVNSIEEVGGAITKLQNNAIQARNLAVKGLEVAHRFGDITQTARDWTSLFLDLNKYKRWKQYL